MKKVIFIGMVFLFLALLLGGVSAVSLDDCNFYYTRGDANDDGILDITDAIYTLNWLFLGGEGIGCNELGDSNGNEDIDLSDAVHTLNYLFMGGQPPMPDFYGEGSDDAPELVVLSSGFDFAISVQTGEEIPVIDVPYSPRLIVFSDLSGESDIVGCYIDIAAIIDVVEGEEYLGSFDRVYHSEWIDSEGNNLQYDPIEWLFDPFETTIFSVDYEGIVSCVDFFGQEGSLRFRINGKLEEDLLGFDYEGSDIEYLLDYSGSAVEAEHEITSREYKEGTAYSREGCCTVKCKKPDGTFEEICKRTIGRDCFYCRDTWTLAPGENYLNAHDYCVDKFGDGSMCVDGNSGEPELTFDSHSICDESKSVDERKCGKGSCEVESMTIIREDKKTGFDVPNNFIDSSGMKIEKGLGYQEGWEKKEMYKLGYGFIVSAKISGDYRFCMPYQFAQEETISEGYRENQDRSRTKIYKKSSLTNSDVSFDVGGGQTSEQRDKYTKKSILLDSSLSSVHEQDLLPDKSVCDEKTNKISYETEIFGGPRPDSYAETSCYFNPDPPNGLWCYDDYKSDVFYGYEGDVKTSFSSEISWYDMPGFEVGCRLIVGGPEQCSRGKSGHIKPDHFSNSKFNMMSIVESSDLTEKGRIVCVLQNINIKNSYSGSLRDSVDKKGRLEGEPNCRCLRQKYYFDKDINKPRWYAVDADGNVVHNALWLESIFNNPWYDCPEASLES